MISAPQRLPDPGERWVLTDGRLSPEIYRYLRELDAAFRALVKLANGPVPHPAYAVADVPDPTLFEGSSIYVSDEAGGAVLAFSDGVDWRRVTDRAVIS